MAPRIRGKHIEPQPSIAKHAFRITAQMAIVMVFGSIVAFKIFSYIYPSALSPSSVSRAIAAAISDASSFIENQPFLNSCPPNFAMHDVSGGYVCANGSAGNVYDKIYQTYPLLGAGRESIYSSTDEGSVAAANDLLRNVYDVSRYKPLRLSSMPTWSEDPYSANYWRFEFYSLRPSLNLLYAFRATDNTAYATKLVTLTQSFISAEPKSKWAWSDPHAVAFRSISLVDIWWKLRQAHQLSDAASTAILAELERTGDFLADPNHYQTENNHCVNEAAALYELAVAFPTMPHAQQWLALAKQRFQWQLGGLIDGDGQLIENSPYYDFYVLGKYVQVYNYSVAQDALIASDFKDRLAVMANFATYILQPDSQVPLIGASIAATINDHGAVQQLAASDPQFEYVLTHGAHGTAPAQNSVYFPDSGLTVMRSGWQGGTAFADSTYLTYNVGKYRTAHSDLDALALTLYGGGGDLLPGAGLYTYTPGAYRNYFHGTAAGNTVVVDGKSQVQGNGTGTPLTTSDGITYQSAESSLYEGVTHQRLVLMLDKDHILVVDRLSSASVHNYQQMWHLFPGAKLSQSGLTVSGIGGTPQRQIAIQQIMPQGITESAVINHRGAEPAGLCSQQYGHLVPCYRIAYSTRGKDAEFVTLLRVGEPGESSTSVAVGGSGQQLTVTQRGQRFTVDLGESAPTLAVARATDPTPPTVRTQPVSASTTTADWTAIGDATLRFERAKQLNNAVVARLTTDSRSPSYLQNTAIRINLLKNNARLALEVNGFSRLSELRLILSNNDWANTATMNLLDALGRTESDSWTNLFIGPSAKWGATGGWRTSAPGFDWSKIDGAEIEMEPRVSGGRPSTVSLGALSLLPEQSQAKLVIIFDDGYQSILRAAAYLHQNGLPANVAVIGKYVDYPTEGHLNLYQLHQLQNDWGWDMVNHTQQHVDGIEDYYDQNNLSDYAKDILQQAAWLESNGLNSAPNWFVYPHGDTNAALEGVVGKYYMFARVTADNPEAYPYGDDHAISDLEVQYPGDEGDAGSAGLTTPNYIDWAIKQAVAYHSTLILTFHRIHSVSTDPVGYPLALFKKTVDDIRQSRIRVLTLSQLDRSNGVPLTNRIYYKPAQPSQITVGILARDQGGANGLGRRLITWLIAGLLLLVLLLGAVALWMRLHQAGRNRATVAATIGDRCAPNATHPLSTALDGYDRQVLSLNPVLYLPLTRPSSSVAGDLSGNGHDGIYYDGAHPLGSAELPNGDLATVFDGDGQYVSVPSFNSLSITSTACLTVEAWVRPDVLQFPHAQGSGYVYILGKGTAGKQEYALRMYSYKNSETPPRPNRISAYVFNLSGGFGSGAYFQDKVTPGEWMMVTFVVDSKTSKQWPDGCITIYKNGVRSGGPVSLGQYGVVPQASNAPFRIATRDLESFFEGAIGKVAVYDTIISDQEIFATYNAMFQGQ
jgi:hypothetical protein